MSNSASLASPSRPPVIPMDTQLPQSMSNLASPSSPPVIPMDTQLPQSMSNLASPSGPPVIPTDPQVREFFKACRKGDFSHCINLIVADPNILLSTNPHMK